MELADEVVAEMNIDFTVFAVTFLNYEFKQTKFFKRQTDGRTDRQAKRQIDRQMTRKTMKDLVRIGTVQCIRWYLLHTADTARSSDYFVFVYIG